LWVGGQILLHGLDELGAPTIPHLVHDGANHAAEAIGFAAGAFIWLFNAIGGAIAGLLVGGLIVAALHLAKRAKPVPAKATS
jgi:predicted DNA repair protein MutK